MKIYVQQSANAVSNRNMLQIILKELQNDTSHLYLHFGELPKLGVNPQSSHSTPNGIYCYQLSMFKDKIERRMDRIREAEKRLLEYKPGDSTTSPTGLKSLVKTLLGHIFPYAADQRFIMLFKYDGPESAVIYTHKYNEEAFRRDFIATTKFFAHHYQTDMEQALELMNKVLAHEFTYKQMQYRFDGLYTEHSLKIYCFTRMVARILASIKVQKITRESMYKRQGEIKEDRVIRKIFDMPYKDFVLSHEALAPKIWANILRYIGYEGIVDNGGGVIYEGEPIQSVFFTNKYLTLLNVADNETKEEAQRRTQNLKEKEIQKLLKNVSAFNDPKVVSYLIRDSYFLENVIRVLQKDYHNARIDVSSINEDGRRLLKTIANKLGMDDLDLFIRGGNYLALLRYLVDEKREDRFYEDKVVDFLLKADKNIKLILSILEETAPKVYDFYLNKQAEILQ